MIKHFLVTDIWESKLEYKKPGIQPISQAILSKNYWVLYHTPVIIVPRRLRQKALEFSATVGHTEKPSLSWEIITSYVVFQYFFHKNWRLHRHFALNKITDSTRALQTLPYQVLFLTSWKTTQTMKVKAFHVGCHTGNCSAWAIHTCCVLTLLGNPLQWVGDGGMQEMLTHLNSKLRCSSLSLFGLE